MLTHELSVTIATAAAAAALPQSDYCAWLWLDERTHKKCRRALIDLLLLVQLSAVTKAIMTSGPMFIDPKWAEGGEKS